MDKTSLVGYMVVMSWTVSFHAEFDPEFDVLSEAVQDSLLEAAGLLGAIGPSLGRPYVDTLTGSRYNNMKELRFMSGKGVWRVAFAFDPERRAIILVAGDKRGTSQKRFYRSLIDKADDRFGRHLNALKGD